MILRFYQAVLGCLGGFWVSQQYSFAARLFFVSIFILVVSDKLPAGRRGYRGTLVVPFWDYLYRILNMNHKKELLRSLWVQGHEDLLVGADRGWIAGLGPGDFAVGGVLDSFLLGVRVWGFAGLRFLEHGGRVYFRAWERFRV